MSQSLKASLAEVGTGKLSNLEAAAALSGLQASLEAAGLGDVLAELPDIYLDEMDDVITAFSSSAKKKLALNSVDQDVLETLITFDAAQVNGMVAAHVDDLRSIILRGVLTGQLPDLSALEGTLQSRLISNIETEVNTGLQAFSRTVTLTKANDLGVDKFLYVGPDDEITRPFCQARVGQIFTRAEIDAWDNGQGLPAATYLGGYNCRHRLRPLSDEKAAELIGSDLG